MKLQFIFEKELEKINFIFTLMNELLDTLQNKKLFLQDLLL